jgi:regulator of replication initiation timing
MEAAASIIAFAQVAGKIAELIFEVSRLWGETKGLPQDLQDLLEELDIFALQFEELKEQLDYEQASGPSRSKSSINRSFVAATKAQSVLQGLVEEINSEIRSKKEGFQRTIVALKSLLKKKDRLESHQKRLKRVIDLLHIAISIRHM